MNTEIKCDKTVYFGDNPGDKVCFGHTYHLYHDGSGNYLRQSNANEPCKLVEVKSRDMSHCMMVCIGGKSDGTVLDIDEKFNLKDVKSGKYLNIREIEDNGKIVKAFLILSNQPTEFSARHFDFCSNRGHIYLDAPMPDDKRRLNQLYSPTNNNEDLLFERNNQATFAFIKPPKDNFT